MCVCVCYVGLWDAKCQSNPMNHGLFKPPHWILEWCLYFAELLQPYLHPHLHPAAPVLRDGCRGVQRGLVPHLNFFLKYSYILYILAGEWCLSGEW